MDPPPDTLRIDPEAVKSDSVPSAPSDREDTIYYDCEDPANTSVPPVSSEQNAELTAGNGPPESSQPPPMLPVELEVSSAPSGSSPGPVRARRAKNSSPRSPAPYSLRSKTRNELLKTAQANDRDQRIAQQKSDQEKQDRILAKELQSKEVRRSERNQS